MKRWLVLFIFLTALIHPALSIAQGTEIVYLPFVGQQPALDGAPIAPTPIPTPTATATVIPTSTTTETIFPTATTTGGADTPTPTGEPTHVPETLAVSGLLTVHFLDVGQGDATLLVGPDFTFLIDAGRHDRSDVMPYLQQAGVEALDLLVGTHPHADHIGQMDKVLEAYPVAEVWMSGDTHTSLTFERVIDAINESDAAYHEPRAGEVYDIGAAVVEVLHPSDLTSDLNGNSVVLRVVFAGVAFLFTGDAEAGSEADMLQSGYALDAHVLKVGHHGSNTSSTQAFLEAINPVLAIWSAGADNSYGHPHDEVIQRLADIGIATHGTAGCGTIAVTIIAQSLWMDATNPDCQQEQLAAHVQTGLVNQSSDVRDGPDTENALVETVDAGTALWALGTNNVRDWQLIRTASGIVGWLPGHVVDGVDAEQLPVIVEPTETPTPTTTATPTPTGTAETTITPTPTVTATATPTITPTATVECVNINSASLEELQLIVHIGPERAVELTDLRPFASVDDMTRISGIGPARLTDIKEQGLACVG